MSFAALFSGITTTQRDYFKHLFKCKWGKERNLHLKIGTLYVKVVFETLVSFTVLGHLDKWPEADR